MRTDKQAASDALERAVGKVRRALALEVINPLKGLAKWVDDQGVYTLKHGEPEQNFLVPGQINAILKAAQVVMANLDVVDAAMNREASMAARVAARFRQAVEENPQKQQDQLQQQAMEFNTPEALEKYLKDHPGADKAKHTVKKDKGESGGAKSKRYDHPEFKDQSSPYYVNQDNKWLQKMGDPASWNYNDAMKLREHLKKRPLLQGSPAEKDRSEAIRQITNWGMLVHDRNRADVDKDVGMG